MKEQISVDSAENMETEEGKKKKSPQQVMREIESDLFEDDNKIKRAHCKFMADQIGVWGAQIIEIIEVSKQQTDELYEKLKQLSLWVDEGFMQEELSKQGKTLTDGQTEEDANLPEEELDLPDDLADLPEEDPDEDIDNASCQQATPTPYHGPEKIDLAKWDKQSMMAGIVKHIVNRQEPEVFLKALIKQKVLTNNILECIDETGLDREEFESSLAKHVLACEKRLAFFD